MSTDNEVIPSTLACIAPLLHVADEIEKEGSRIAYLYRLCAFQKACRVDPSSSGRGVSQFMTLLQQRVQRDNYQTLVDGVKRSDAREIGSFYRHYYEHNVGAGVQGRQLADRAQLEKDDRIAGVLFEVLCVVNKSETASRW